MGKRLTPQAKAQRLHAQGFSDRQIAKATGYSASSVGRIRRGQQSGEKISAPLGEFFKLGKRAKETVVSGAIPLPSAKPAPAPKGRVRAAVEKAVISPLRRAEGHISQLDGDTMVVVQITSRSTGKSRTLFARGGIEVREIRGDLKGALTAQAQRQGGNVDSISDPKIDWDDVVDISIEEY